MRVVMLGTGGSAGVPTIGGEDGRGDWGACDPAEPRNRRSRASIVIEHRGARLLVDTAPELRSQLIGCGIPSIDAIVYTHAHADHITGLDDIRLLNRIIDRPLDCYASPATLSELAIRFDYAFRPYKPPGFFRPVLLAHVLDAGDRAEIAGMTVQAFDQGHGFGRTLGLRIGAFAYSTDVVALDEAAFRVLRGVDTWVVGCYQRQPHHTHAHVELAVAWAARLGARRTVLTHMGIDMDWAWLVEHLPSGVEPAFDGMVLEVGP